MRARNFGRFWRYHSLRSGGGEALGLMSSRFVALRYGSGKKKLAVQSAGFLDGQD